MTPSIAARDAFPPVLRGMAALVLLLVLGVIVLVIALMLLRRSVERRQRHKPTDLTDSWSEAGRRMPTPPADQESDEGENEPDTGGAPPR